MRRSLHKVLPDLTGAGRLTQAAGNLYGDKVGTLSEKGGLNGGIKLRGREVGRKNSPRQGRSEQ